MNDFRGADTSQQDDDGISPETASLSYHPCLRLSSNPDWGFLVAFWTFSRPLPAIFQL